MLVLKCYGDGNIIQREKSRRNKSQTDFIEISVVYRWFDCENLFLCHEYAIIIIIIIKCVVFISMDWIHREWIALIHRKLVMILKIA